MFFFLRSLEGKATEGAEVTKDTSGPADVSEEEKKKLRAERFGRTPNVPFFAVTVFKITTKALIQFWVIASRVILIWG